MLLLQIEEKKNRLSFYSHLFILKHMVKFQTDTNLVTKTLSYKLVSNQFWHGRGLCIENSAMDENSDPKPFSYETPVCFVTLLRFPPSLLLCTDQIGAEPLAATACSLEWFNISGLNMPIKSLIRDFIPTRILQGALSNTKKTLAPKKSATSL